ncbi:hypothetical protein [Synechococcus phage Ssp-JY42]|nr:hypothetical protein [Synechococcus phage Yong-M4-211]
MEARRYTYAASLSWGGDEPTAELEVEVSFSVAWGQPESGRFGRPEDYDPGAASEVEDLKLLSVDGVGGPFDQHDEAAILQEIAQNHAQAMLQEAAEDDAGRRDSYLEAEADERRWGLD